MSNSGCVFFSPRISVCGFVPPQSRDMIWAGVAQEPWWMKDTLRTPEVLDSSLTESSSGHRHSGSPILGDPPEPPTLVPRAGLSTQGAAVCRGSPPSAGLRSVGRPSSQHGAAFLPPGRVASWLPSLLDPSGRSLGGQERLLSAHIQQLQESNCCSGRRGGGGQAYFP